MPKRWWIDSGWMSKIIIKHSISPIFYLSFFLLIHIIINDMKLNDFKYILQIRTGSSRLPNKMLKKFHNNLTIPEIIVNKLSTAGIEEKNIIIATTLNPNDDQIINLFSNSKCLLFRGDENNVLKRFIDAAEKYETQHFFRICADNPFLNTNFIKEIIEIENILEYDYSSFQLYDGTPAIKTHFGFFCEFTNLSTLKKVSTITEEKTDVEHVTPYIYNNPKKFNIKMLDIPQEIQENNWLRLTIDTENDFNYAQQIFEMLPFSNDYTKIILFSKKFSSKMRETINTNLK